MCTYYRGCGPCQMLNWPFLCYMLWMSVRCIVPKSLYDSAKFIWHEHHWVKWVIGNCGDFRLIPSDPSCPILEQCFKDFLCLFDHLGRIILNGGGHLVFFLKDIMAYFDSPSHL